MTDSPTPTPDAITAAFREARENDKEMAKPLPLNKQACCRPMFESKEGQPFTHDPDCPWRLRMAALDKCEQAWEATVQAAFASIEDVRAKHVDTFEGHDRMLVSATIASCMSAVTSALRGKP